MGEGAVRVNSAQHFGSRHVSPADPSPLAAAETKTSIFFLFQRGCECPPFCEVFPLHITTPT